MASNDGKAEVDQESELTEEITEETTDADNNVRMVSNDGIAEVYQESELTEEITGETTDADNNERMVSNDGIAGVDQESELTEEITGETTDAENNIRMVSNDGTGEVDKESEITEEITEETIETNFKTQRSYLEKHVDVTDLIAYYELFTQEERRILHQENQVNRDAAARSAFSMIEERTHSDRYTQLLFALDNAGCPKLVDLLKGKLVPGNTVNRQRINSATRHICERLTPSNVLPYLVTWGVITNGESEKIAKKERLESRLNAALDLLFMLPNRSRHWYILFLQALVYGDEHTQLAELIDQRKAAQIKAQRLAGMKTHLSDSNMSLQDPIQENTVTQIYERITATDGSQCITQNDESKLKTSTGPLDVWCDLCYDVTGDVTQACGFCLECDRFICESCCGTHRKLPILRTHIIVQGEQMSNVYKPVKYLNCTAHSGTLKN